MHLKSACQFHESGIKKALVSQFLHPKCHQKYPNIFNSKSIVIQFKSIINDIISSKISSCNTHVPVAIMA